MEAATPLRQPSVRTAGDTVVVESLVVEDACAAQVAREAPDAARAVTDAIEIGARVLERETAGAQADFVKGEFDKLSKDVSQRTRELADGFAEQFEDLFGADSGQLVKIFERHFSEDSSGSVPNRVEKALSEVRGSIREDIYKQFTSGEHNPLTDFKAGMIQAMKSAEVRQTAGLQGIEGRMAKLQVELQALRDEREKVEELAAEREKGTAKGRTYEEAVFETVDAIAGPQGDDCEALGDLKGEGGKTGDVVVGIDGCKGRERGRIVFEAKDRRLSKNEAMKELDRALTQRGADFAVLVVPSEEELPANTRSLREYNGDKLLVAWSPDDGTAITLEVAYSLARARVLMDAADGEEIDIACIRDTSERALQSLTEARKIKTQLTNARNSVDGARELVDDLEAKIRSHLEDIQSVTSGQQQLS